jgi:hypothetical protein
MVNFLIYTKPTPRMIFFLLSMELLLEFVFQMDVILSLTIVRDLLSVMLPLLVLP